MQMQTLYLTEAGRARTIAEMQVLGGRIRAILSRDKTATKSGSGDNTWCWDEEDRELEILKTQRDQKLGILAHARVIPAPTDTRWVACGLKVTFDVTRGKKTQRKCYVIGGLEDTDTTVSPPVVSYACPCIKAIMGKKVGETADFSFPTGEEAEVRVVKIEFP